MRFDDFRVTGAAASVPFKETLNLEGFAKFVDGSGGGVGEIGEECVCLGASYGPQVDACAGRIEVVNETVR